MTILPDRPNVTYWWSCIWEGSAINVVTLSSLLVTHLRVKQICTQKLSKFDNVCEFHPWPDLTWPDCLFLKVVSSVNWLRSCDLKASCHGKRASQNIVYGQAGQLPSHRHDPHPLFAQPRHPNVDVKAVIYWVHETSRQCISRAPVRLLCVLKSLKENSEEKVVCRYWAVSH